MKGLKHIFILFLLLTCKEVSSQCIASTPRNPTVFTNNNLLGSVAWGTPSNVASSNNIRSSAGALIGILSTASANYNMESGFGFTLPAYAIICGIQVDVEKRQQGVLIGSSVQDNSVKIVKNGVVLGSEHASAAAWPSTDTYFSYGGPGDLWGTSWTAADINASNFGIAHSANLNAGLVSLFLTAEIDHLQITVYYDLILPIKLTDFSATCKNDGVNLNWSVAAEASGSYFTIERSADGVNFTEIGKVEGNNNNNKTLGYSFTDRSPEKEISYYRLKQTDANNATSYSSVIFSECKFTASNKPFPNPSNGKFSLNGEGELTVYGMNGKLIYSQNISDHTNIDLTDQPRGIYFYQLISLETIVSSGKLIIE